MDYCDHVWKQPILYFVYPPVEFSREAPLVGRECITVCTTSL